MSANGTHAAYKSPSRLRAANSGRLTFSAPQRYLCVLTHVGSYRFQYASTGAHINSKVKKQPIIYSTLYMMPTQVAHKNVRVKLTLSRR